MAALHKACWVQWLGTTVLNSLRPAAFSCSVEKALKSILVLQRPEFHAPCNSTAISLIKCEPPERTGASISWLAGLMYRAALLAVAGHPISKQILPLLHMAFLCNQHRQSQSKKLASQLYTLQPAVVGVLCTLIDFTAPCLIGRAPACH